MPAERSLLRGWAALTALVAALSLVLQYLLLLRGSVGSAVATLRFFGYFTIPSNLGVCLGGARLASGRALRAPVAAVLALCIGVTGLIYVLALQGLWQPAGLQWWVDMGLHYAVPALYLAGWLLLLPHGGLRWRALGAVMLVPVAYLGWAMVVTALTGQAPYPFLEWKRLGAAAFALNLLRVAGVFVLGWTLLWALDRWRRR
ncbi:Pr6Pr family membrane protein [Stenotrophomonas sp.]|uniref:Pr6Pr family membrane protein n=1 Tax=Stenotrophomonas sp. TaxID=69392 RepID=UPI002D2C0AE1|nr:Pr6Pr family membrane protein [Stenotrophomonas sp.]HYQ24329.1 Pr6Pr family membrane protein [Stenotrophomonas sp.]